VERISEAEVLVFGGVVEDRKLTNRLSVCPLSVVCSRSPMCIDHILKDGYIYRNEQGSFWIWRKTLNWCVLYDDKIAFFTDSKGNVIRVFHPIE